MLVSLTVGKVDAGVAVLLTEDKRLIEFPSILLPPDISSGSIVDITVARNLASEAASANAFQSLQNTIYKTFGQRSPVPPVLRCRNATQTSVVLEWDPINLHTASLRSLSLFRNGSKAGSIPRPFEMHSTKISGLAVDTEYNFHLVLRTSAGTYSSDKLVVRTHKMTELSGITITPGVMPAALRESLQLTVEKIGAKIVDTVRIDTTHFVCTEGRGQAWEKAVEMNVPVVVPDWIKGCENEGRIVGVRGYYLNADPRLRQIGPGIISQQGSPQIQHQSPRPPQSQMVSPRTEITPPTPERAKPQQRIGEARPSADRPPPPPPKTESPSKPSTPEPKTSTDENKALRDHVKPQTPKLPSKEEDEGEDSDASDDTERELHTAREAPLAEKSNEATLPIRPHEQSNGAGPSDDGKFQDIAL